MRKQNIHKTKKNFNFIKQILPNQLVPFPFQTLPSMMKADIIVSEEEVIPAMRKIT